MPLVPTVNGGGAPEGLFEVTADPLDPQRLIDYVRRDESGAVAVFLGVVRDNSMGRRVLYLEYDAYPEMATRVMREIAEEAMARWPITGIAMQHRTGRLEIGETSLLIAVSSPHRKEAFEACHHLVDRFKEVVPVWKKEVWEGGEVWIEGEPVGGLNKFFYHAYQVRLKGKALKARNKTAYYVGKWALIGLLIWALFF